MLPAIGHLVIYATEQLYDKMFRTHGVLLSALALAPKA
jgi:hypothetical protein